MSVASDSGSSADFDKAQFDEEFDAVAGEPDELTEAQAAEEIDPCGWTCSWTCTWTG